MSSFSQRKGIKPVKSIQVDSMDADLRNSLWNALSICYWERFEDYSSIRSSRKKELDTFLLGLWMLHLKKPIDAVKRPWHHIHKEMREYFFICEWQKIYEFIEYVANKCPLDLTDVTFIPICNKFLEREVSAYRFVGTKITEITSETEISEIEEALKAENYLKPVANHLERALDLLADRKSPDYRNSIKESISAVEAICQLITDNPKATLGQALKEIENKVTIHPALKASFDKLYGYTSDADGIRHAMSDEPNLKFEDAKFMLVSCSAFINYLKSKASTSGINL